MVKKLKLIELLFAILSVVVFVFVLNKYYNKHVFNRIQNKNIEKVLSLKSNLSYWKYVVFHSIYFPESKLSIRQNMPIVEYRKSENQKLVSGVAGIPVLLYHGITDKPKSEDVTEKEFLEQMSALKKSGYQTITINEFERYVKGELRLNNKNILITFDDGRKDSLYKADPILRLFGYNAVMYAIDEHSLNSQDSVYYLNKTEIEKFSKGDVWSFQSHGDEDHNQILINSDGKKGHFVGQKMWIESNCRLETDSEFESRIRKDLVKSKNDIANITNQEVLSYSFPFGDYGQNYKDNHLKDIVIKVASQIYPVLFIQFRPEETTGYYRNSYVLNENKHIFKRILITQDITPVDLINLLNSSTPKNIPYYFSSSEESWISTSSKRLDEVKVLNNGQIEIGSSDKSSSAEGYLDGTFGWIDYRFYSDFESENTKQVSLIGRGIDGNNFISCVYGNNQVYISQTVNGMVNILAKYSSTSFNVTNEKFTLSLEFSGNKVTCYKGGVKLVVGYITDSNLDHGVIGYKTWAKGQGIMKSIISNIHVEKI